jgi:hypothetical protein
MMTITMTMTPTLNSTGLGPNGGEIESIMMSDHDPHYDSTDLRTQEEEEEEQKQYERLQGHCSNLVTFQKLVLNITSNRPKIEQSRRCY